MSNGRRQIEEKIRLLFIWIISIFRFKIGYLQSMKISKRKSEHIRIVLERNVGFKKKTSGFERYELVHCALPEINLKDVSTEVQFLNKKLSFPLMVSAMTGGYSGAVNINKQLAVVCREEGVALGVGSQRQILENSHHLDSYRIVRQTAPDNVIVGNIGAEQVAEIQDVSVFQRMVDLIEADALAIHLNPLQEALQPEGKARFHGVLGGIERLVRKLDVPIIVKEIGCGISEKVARVLVDVGVDYIDVAGAGGTSWAGIESYRNPDNALALRFWDWGIPTVESLERIARIPGARTIASGGIDNGVIMAKALALGAELCSAALPFLIALMKKNVNGLVDLLRVWRKELRTAMFLTGCSKIKDLQREGVIIRWDSMRESRI
jgi:isopentenyl-diphosphate delta-isomerase